MPAIRLDQLRKQVADIAQLFSYPVEFSKALYILFDQYADRTQRSGQSGEPPPLITTFNVPPPILPTILREISSLINQHPSAALNLCIQLWKEPYLEFRLLAIKILGSVKFSYPSTILDVVSKWIEPDIEEHLLNVILDEGLSNIRIYSPEIFMGLVENWLTSQDAFQIKLGLQSLLYLIHTPDFKNISKIFLMLNPFIRNAPLQFRPDILAILRVLARHNPKETAYYFRMEIDTGLSEDSKWYLRNCLKEFPDETERSLRKYVRSSHTNKDT